MGAPPLEDAPSGRSGAVLSESCKILQLDRYSAWSTDTHTRPRPRTLAQPSPAFSPAEKLVLTPQESGGFMRKALLVVILAGASAFAGTVSVTGLQWLFNPSFFGTHFWTGPFGATPTFQGLLNSGLRQPGKIVFGSGDADFDIGSNNTLHATTLIFFINPTFRTAQIGVSA